MAILNEIVLEFDRRAASRDIGRLQNLRVMLKGLKHKPGNSVFRSANNEEWAFHVGGREELQFNIGVELLPKEQLRHGVAFSFETSRSMPSIE